MGSYINKYETAEQYATGIRPLDNSSVNLVDEMLKYDGVNVFVDTPDTGDALYCGPNFNKVYVKLDTINNTQMVNYGYTPVGVVGHRFADDVIILNKANAKKKWSDVYRWRIAGWSGNTAVSTITLNGTAITNTFTASGTTDAATWVSEFNAFLVTNNILLSNWHAEVKTINGTVTPVLVYQAYTSYPGKVTLMTGGYTLSVVNGWQYAANAEGLMRIGGRGGGKGAIMNLGKALSHFTADLNAGITNPDTDQTVTNGAVNNDYPICLPGYLGTSANVTTDRCAALRAYFGEGEEGWINYMTSIQAKWLSEYGSADFANQKGKVISYALSGETFTKYDTSNNSTGEFSVYPAIQYCTDVAYNGVADLDLGSWYLPSLFEMVPVWSKLRYSRYFRTTTSRSADPINRTMLAIGGTEIDNRTYAWSSVHINVLEAWVFYGYTGCADVSFLHTDRLAVPCVRLKI